MAGTDLAFSTTSSFSSSSSSSFSSGFSNPSSNPTSTASPISFGFDSGTTSSTTAEAASPFGGSSIFGSSPSPALSLFDSSTGAGLTSNVFGSSSASGSTPISNLFGSGTTPLGSSLSGSAPTTNIFGSGTAQNMFGSSTAASFSSHFGSSLSGAASSSNLFGSVSAPNILVSSSAASASNPFGSPSLATGHTASMFASATAAESPSPSSSPFGTSTLFASHASGSSNLSGFGNAPSSSTFGFSSGASNSRTTTPSFGSGLASSSFLFGSSLSASNAANTAPLSESGRIPSSSVFGSSTAASTSVSMPPVFDGKSPAGGLFAPSTPSSSTTVASMGNTPSFGSSFGSTLGLSGSSSSMFGSSPATLFGSLSSSSLATSPPLTTNASSSASLAPGFSFATASGSLGNAPLFGSSSASTLGLTGSSSLFSSSPAPQFGSFSSSSTTTSFPVSASGFSFASASGSPGFSFPAASATGVGTATTTHAASFLTVPTSASSGFSFLKSTASLASGATSSSSSSSPSFGTTGFQSSALTSPLSSATSKAAATGTTPSATSSSVLSAATAFSIASPASSGFTGFSAATAPVASSGATSAFSLSLKSPSPIAASSTSSQSQSVSALPSFGVPSFASTTATSSTASSSVQTTSPLVVSSSSGTTSTTHTALASAPKLPSEITGRTVEEIIKEGNAELQKRAGKFKKLANAIAEWDCRILQNREILLTLESEVAKVVEAQGSLEGQLELIETHQDEVNKALQSMEEEAERIYGEECGLLLDDDAASTRDAMFEQAEMIERELEHMTEQIKSIINTINSNKGGELDVTDGMTPLDIVVRILNNQLSSLMWVEEKAEEFSSLIQKLANKGSATGVEPALSACKLYEQLRREDAAVKIQKNFQCYIAWKTYSTLQDSTIILQTGMRSMTARNEFRFRKQTKAAIKVQAHFRCHREYAYYRSLQKAAIVTQCGWRQRVARKEFRSLRMAARETEAKDKLEKKVEELTWRLQFEKRLRTELEETKAQELSKLQEALHSIQTQVEEANARVIKEREVARKAIEEAPPVIKETPVMVQDMAKIDALTAEVESLKVAEEAKKACADAENSNMDLAKKLGEAEGKVEQFQDSVQRLEEKLSNLELENQVLRQALTMSPTGNSICARPRMTIVQKTPENGNVLNGETKVVHDMVIVAANSKEPESEEKPQKSLNDKQQENQDLLIKCISQDLGFSGGKPVAACVIYKCLLHWRSFEVERTTVFDLIIRTVASAIEGTDNNDVLAYWLCNTSTLLMLLQHTLEASGAASLTPQRRRSSSASLFGRMSQGLRGSPQSAGLLFLNGRMLGRLDDLRQVEAKYPALLFKQQLTAFLEKIYGMIRDNLKKEISQLLGLCIQAPRTRASLVKGCSLANAVAKQALISHWQSIVKSLDSYLKMMKANYVPPFLVRKVLTQSFSFINVQLFNSLLLRRECCSFSNGDYVKAGLAELEHWCCYATEEYVGLAWDELKHIRQAVGFLVIHQKPKKTLNEITTELCPVLSIQQLYWISTMYWDDKYGTHSVSSEVISSMRVMMTEDSNNAGSSSFLLDDDSSIPFSVDDISKTMQKVDVADVEPPPLIRENSSFVFLHQRSDG